MSVTAGVTRLDEMANRWPNRIQSIDLSGYMDESTEHLVKPAADYADEVGTLIFTPPEASGLEMPFNTFKNHMRFREGEVTVWTGYKGHGKSAALSQVLNCAMMREQKVFILSPEFRAARVIERMVYQRYATRNITGPQLAEWFKWAADKLWLYDAQSSLKSDDVVAICRYAQDKFKVDHILIDSLMKVGIAPDDYGKQKAFVDRIQSIAHNAPVHIHLVAHARKGASDERPPQLHDIKGTSEIADMVENVMVIWRNKQKEKAQSLGDGKKNDEPDAMMIVEAQRNAEGWVGGVALWYDKRSMLFSETDQRCPV